MGLVIKAKRLKWTHGRVPFAFGWKSDKSAAQVEKDGVLQAIDEWNSDTHNLAVKFVPHNGEPDYILFRNNPLTDSGGSLVGNHHGPQIIWVHRPENFNDDDTKFIIRRLMLHEMGHALGLFHEQSRSDRDDHVEIHWDNIIPIYLPQFAKERQAEDFGAYDYDSIMHYRWNEYAIHDDKPTITSKDPNHPINKDTKHDELSVGDVDAVRHIYGPAASTTAIVSNLLQSLKQFTAGGAGGSPQAKAAIDAAVKAATDAAAKAKSDAEKAAEEAADAAEKAAEAAAAQAAADAAAAKAAAEAETAKAVQATADALNKIPHPHL